MNALAATAATLAIDIDLSAIKTGLENVKAAPGRMRQHLLSNNVRIIDDTYNANPFSLEAATHTLAEFSGTKILVLGDMKELGPDANQFHFQAGQHIKAAGIQHLLTYGNLSKAATDGFGENAAHFTDYETLITALKPYLTSHATVLVKGSRSMQMEKVIAKIIPEEQLEHIH